MITAKQTHWGQYKPYGDRVFEWDIITTENEGPDEVLKYCRALNSGFENIPPYSEWSKNIRIGGAKEHDMRYYFNGYYELKPTKEGYYFKVVEPFTD